jgi:4a-hydroxytetrahydrobiopterin dehydratase
MSKNDPANKICVPCTTSAPALKGEALRTLQKKLGAEWKVVNEHHLTRAYKFKDFQQALDFTNKVGAIAEENNHHPDILLGWGKVEISLWTHSIDGLSESDFVVASKIEQLLRNKPTL